MLAPKRQLWFWLVLTRDDEGVAKLASCTSLAVVAGEGATVRDDAIVVVCVYVGVSRLCDEHNVWLCTQSWVCRQAWAKGECLKSTGIIRAKPELEVWVTKLNNPTNHHGQPFYKQEAKHAKCSISLFATAGA